MSDDERKCKLLKQRKWAQDYRKKNLEYNAGLEEQIQTLRRENDDLRERINSLFQELLFYASQEHHIVNNYTQIPSILPWPNRLSSGWMGGSALQPAQALIPPQIYLQGQQSFPVTLPIPNTNTVTSASIITNTGAGSTNVARPNENVIPLYMTHQQQQGPSGNQDGRPRTSRHLTENATDSTQDALLDRKSDVAAIMESYGRSSTAHGSFASKYGVEK